MTEVLLIAEDAALERFTSRLARRVAQEIRAKVRLRSTIAFGGTGGVYRELQTIRQAWQGKRTEPPDGIIAAIDANCLGFARRRDEIRKKAGPLADRTVPAIADPHVERWFLLDAQAFRRVLGHSCRAPGLKCEKDRYKQLLLEAVREAGVRPLLGGIEFAEELAESLDLSRASREDAGLELFLDEWRGFLRRNRS